MKNAVWILWSLGLALSLVHPAESLAGQNVVVVLDDSGSMNDRMKSKRSTTKIEAAKTALLAVLESLPDDANVGITLLNGRINGGSWVIPLGPVDIEKTRSMMQRVVAKGRTPLGRFMKVGADALLTMRADDHYGIYRLLIVTDGEANDGRIVKRYLPDILSRGITVDVIGVDMAADHSLATRVDSYRRADDPDRLIAAVKEVFAEVSDEGGDAGESDFDSLEAIPTEIAAAVIAALAETDNRLIGESRRRLRKNDSSGRQATQNSHSGNSADSSPSSPSSHAPDSPLGHNGPPLNVPRKHRFSFYIVLIVAALLFVRIIRAVFRSARR